MKAVVLERFGDRRQSVTSIRLRSAHDVRIDVGASGVCHTDLCARRGQYPFQLPLLLGHEGPSPRSGRPSRWCNPETR
ncbi:alcohol dehydrogenase catalytic domain-containing protein [Rhodococcus opacus]